MPRWRTLQRGAAVLLLVSSAASRAGAAPVSSSASFVLQQTTVDGGGCAGSSAGYRLDASTGQESAIGASATPAHVLQSGFWSFVGSTLVPVVLTAAKGAFGPEEVDLTWTGNGSPYAVYRSKDPAGIFQGFLVTEPSHAYTDAPPYMELWFYNVLSTAPGPLAEPGDRAAQGPVAGEPPRESLGR